MWVGTSSRRIGADPEPSDPAPPSAAPSPLSPRSVLARLLRRPEIGAACGVVAVFTFFAFDAGDSGFLTLDAARDYVEVAAELGIIAVAITLLMIAGEFDISVGAMLGAAGVLIGVAVTIWGWPLWMAILLAVATAILVGLLNGYLTVKTALPSFIVTLAALFVLRGASLGGLRIASGSTQLGGVREAVEGEPFVFLFAGEIGGFSASVFWWLGLTALAAWVLTRTRFGNWVMTTGGDPVAAHNLGVPVKRVKIVLFVCTALAATLVAAITVVRNGSAQVNLGEQTEFEVITAAVIGGTLLGGGYGSVVGAALGAMIFAMVSQGFFYTGIDPDWYQVFLGAMLLIAVVFNTYVQKRALRDT
jgi:simple sugar transport system permease protein